MHKVLGLSLFFHREDNPTVEDLYQSLCQDLKTEIVGWLNLQNDPDVLADWPNTNWSNDDQHVIIRCTEWKAETGFERRLLQLQLTQRQDDYDWKIDLRLGRVREEDVILSGEWSISTFKLRTPFKEMPELLTFTSRYFCKNEDELYAGKTYVVSNNKVGDLVDFIKSSERRLPIVLISRPRSSSKYLLTDTGALARRVQGSAHVTKLKDNKTAQQLLRLLPDHGCYNGAVRIFWPGFKDTDDRGLHHLWLPSELRAKEESTIRNEIFEEIAQKLPLLYTKHRDIEDLERQQVAEREAKQRKQSEEHWKEQSEQLKLKLQEREDDLDTYEQLFKELEREYDDLKRRYKELEGEYSQSRDENNKLRSDVGFWKRRVRELQFGRQPEMDEEQSIGCTIYLFSKAQKRYESFNDDERNYWDEHVLEKLLNERMRDNQSEPVEGANGIWVYPRSGTAGGRRLFFYAEDNDIYVCELFPNHDEYEKAHDKAREQGLDRQDYDDSKQWHVGGV